MKERKRLDAVRGCLLGGAIGDALGYPVEFRQWSGIQRKYGPRGIENYERDFDSGLALVSDDTQMTLYTANGLLMYDTCQALGIEVAAPAQCVFDAYRDWYFCQRSAKLPEGNRSWLSELPEMHERRAPGNTCMSALAGGLAGSMDAPINHSKGCGGIMRVAPVALWGRGTRPVESTDLLSAEAAALTHGHPLGWMSAAALADIVARAAYSDGEADLFRITADCRSTMETLFGGNEYVWKVLDCIDQAVALAQNDDTDVRNIVKLGEGWTGEEALSISLYCALRHQDDFSAAVIAAVNHSGDSDSTGAITGNIVGARLGAQAIDKKWFEGLELRDAILELADDLYRGCPVNDAGRLTDAAWLGKYGDLCK